MKIFCCLAALAGLVALAGCGAMPLPSKPEVLSATSGVVISNVGANRDDAWGIGITVENRGSVDYEQATAEMEWEPAERAARVANGDSGAAPSYVAIAESRDSRDWGARSFDLPPGARKVMHAAVSDPDNYGQYGLPHGAVSLVVVRNARGEVIAQTDPVRTP